MLKTFKKTKSAKFEKYRVEIDDNGRKEVYNKNEVGDNKIGDDEIDDNVILKKKNY